MPVHRICPVCKAKFSIPPSRLARMGTIQKNPPCCSMKCACAIRVRSPKHGHCKKSGWSKETGIRAATILRRLGFGWLPRKALTVDPRKYHNRS